MKKKKKYFKCELEEIKRLYVSCGAAGCVKCLKRHSKASISRRARSIGLKTSGASERISWKMKEIKEIKEKFPRGNYTACARCLERHTPGAVIRMAYNLKIKYIGAENKYLKRNPWTTDELEDLLAAHEYGGFKSCYKNFPYRTRVSVRNRYYLAMKGKKWAVRLKPALSSTGRPADD